MRVFPPYAKEGRSEVTSGAWGGGLVQGRLVGVIAASVLLLTLIALATPTSANGYQSNGPYPLAYARAATYQSTGPAFDYGEPPWTEKSQVILEVLTDPQGIPMVRYPWG